MVKCLSYLRFILICMWYFLNINKQYLSIYIYILYYHTNFILYYLFNPSPYDEFFKFPSIKDQKILRGHCFAEAWYRRARGARKGSMARCATRKFGGDLGPGENDENQRLKWEWLAGHLSFNRWYKWKGLRWGLFWILDWPKTAESQTWSGWLVGLRVSPFYFRYKGSPACWIKMVAGQRLPW